VEKKTIKREMFNDLVSHFMIGAGIITVVIVRCF
jgi:hypothetical protein